MLELLKQWCPCLWWLQDKSTPQDATNQEGYSGIGLREMQTPCPARHNQLYESDDDRLVWEKDPNSCWLAEEDSSSDEAPVPKQASTSPSNPPIVASSPQRSTSNRENHPVRSYSNRGSVCKEGRSASYASTASTQKGNCGVAWNSDVEIDPPADIRLEAPPRTPDPTLDRFLIGGYMTPQIVGKANSTRRYNPLQRIPRHNTPFEERMEHEIMEEATARSAVRKRRSRTED
ncbi:hypothetical protein BSKO_07825 [Bryopsis sp. KO-2023]|nr:hypothetical protein BSKO_07825 [Bryopsis sp. KO-2023]